MFISGQAIGKIASVAKHRSRTKYRIVCGRRRRFYLTQINFD